MTKSELIAKLAGRYPQLVAKDAELAVKMERWFGVDIRFLDEKIAALRFTGKFDRETCEEALRALQITADFTYAHNGKSILINH